MGNLGWGRSALRCWLFGACALACVLGAAPFLRELNRQRDALGLNAFADVREIPPELALPATALGPFRAILIDLLWLRATELQEEGKFFELVQLYDWISKLEPRFPMVWEYMAWNFAYNISVKFPLPRNDQPIPPDQPDSHELRWQWVQRGIETLRDRGIPYNPRATSLYRELAWIYSHKIGGTTDDANDYYKFRLALQMHLALGAPPYLDRLRAIAAAPATEAELLRDEEVAALVKQLREAGLDPFARALETANRDPGLPEAARTILDSPANAAAAARLDAFLRATHLRDRLHLDPRKMLEYMERFGPIDWRLPDALAFYWAARSVEMAEEGADIERAVNADRILFHSLANLYRRGHLIFYPPKPGEPVVWVASPNFAFLDRVVKLHAAIAERYKGSPFETPTREAYLNFLRDAIVDLYLHNDRRRAAHYHKLLTDIGPEDKEQSLDDFVASREIEFLKAMNLDQVRNRLQAYYTQALWWASLGDLDQAQGQESFAQLLYSRYLGQRSTRLPSLREIRKAALRQAIRSFQPFQVARLRELYPKAVEEAEAEVEKEKGKAPK